MEDGTHLTEKGKRAEKRLHRLERKKERHMEDRDSWTNVYEWAAERDRIDEAIDRIEGNFADREDEAGYFKHPAKE